MIEWLDEPYPTPSLLPKDKNLRAQVRAFAQSIACDIHPLQNLRVLQFLKGELQLGQEQADQWCRQWISNGLSACEALLARSDKRYTFCFGDQPGFADICLIPQVYSARRFKVDLSAMPYICSIFEICESLPAFQQARPAAQPDAEE
jgi:maleylacetoacetate isomerase